MNIYVGNISYDVTEDELRQEFSRYGEVTSVKLIMDRETNRPKGFGFVEMTRDTEAQEAIRALDGNSMNGRNLRVNEAKPKEPRNDRPRW